MLILFDGNGTLLSDIGENKPWWLAISAVFRDFDRQPPSLETYFREMEMYRGAWAPIYNARGIKLSTDELNARYCRHYERLLEHVNLTPGVSTVLTWLRDLKITVGIVTMQPYHLLMPILRRYEIDDLFKYMWFDAFNKTRAFNFLLDVESNIDPKKCCYIGDMPGDVRHARMAEINTAAFIHGAVPQDLILAEKPDFYDYTIAGLVGQLLAYKGYI